MRRSLAGYILVIGWLGATGALADDRPPQPAPVKHHRAKAASARPSFAPSTSVSDRQPLDDLIKGSPDQQAAERNDRERAGLKPIDHSKDDFFSDWRGLR